MRNLETFAYAKYRITHPIAGRGDHTCGAFVIPFELPLTGAMIPLNVIASSGEGWDHVSVSLLHRAPSWDEMSFIYLAFFEPHEGAMQLHVPAADHINVHPYCLHLWRPQGAPLPRPPGWMVG